MVLRIRRLSIFRVFFDKVFELQTFLIMEFVATCAFGLEKLVQEELKKLGLWIVKSEDGRITFQGDEMSMIRANLWSRCADRILMKAGDFHAVTFDELFDAVFAIEWEKYIGPNDAFPVYASTTKSVLHSEPAIQSIVKKAIVKRLLAKHGTESLPEDSGLTIEILVKFNKDQALVGLNTSGVSLHKRGYRISAGVAPIKETLASALVKLSGWTPDRPLVDLFCGSGTIPIEAALIALNIAPGLQRSFAFEEWLS